MPKRHCAAAGQTHRFECARVTQAIAQNDFLAMVLWLCKDLGDHLVPVNSALASGQLRPAKINAGQLELGEFLGNHLG